MATVTSYKTGFISIDRETNTVYVWTTYSGYWLRTRSEHSAKLLITKRIKEAQSDG